MTVELPNQGALTGSTNAVDADEDSDCNEDDEEQGATECEYEYCRDRRKDGSASNECQVVASGSAHRARM